MSMLYSLVITYEELFRVESRLLSIASDVYASFPRCLVLFEFNLVMI